MQISSTPSLPVPANEVRVGMIRHGRSNMPAVSDLNRAVGDPNGYASLEDAIAALEPITAAEAGGAAAAVFQQPDGRFVGHALRTVRQPKYHFQSGEYLESGFRFEAPGAVALVDGHRSILRPADGSQAAMPSSPVPVRATTQVGKLARPWKFDQGLLAGAALSPGTGYASLEDAVAAMRETTRGIGSAVVYRDGRVFQARELLLNTDQLGAYNPWPFMKRFDIAPVVANVKWSDPATVAIVDGDSVTLRPA